MGPGDGFSFFCLFVCLFSDQFLTGMRYQAKLLTLSPYFTIIYAMMLLSILSFVRKFSAAIIIFNFISFISLDVLRNGTSIARL